MNPSGYRITPETAHELLLRDWFDDDYDILEMLDTMDDPTFDYIYARRHEYSTRVRYCIDPNDYLRTTKMKILELSDDDMKKKDEELDKMVEQKIDELWKKQPKTDRPADDLDDMFDRSWDSFQNSKKALEMYLKSKKQSYVPPNLRGKGPTDPMVEELEANIKHRENEFKKLEELVDRADNDWQLRKRNEFRFSYLQGSVREVS